VTISKDPLLLGPLSQEDLADAKSRVLYLRETERSEGGVRASIDPDDSALRRSEGVIGLEPVSLLANLLDYQAELATEIVALCKRRPPDNIGLVALPTGAGKTRTAVCAALQLIAQGSVDRVLWLAPSSELLEQAIGAFEALWPTVGSPSGGLDLLRCHVLKAYPVAKRAAVYFSTPQMLYKRLLRERSRLPLWNLVIFDEAHLAEAPTFRDALTLARELGGTEAPCFGLSATPGRSDESETDSLVGLFRRRLLTSHLLGKDPFDSLRKRGVLARVHFRTIPLNGPITRSQKEAVADVERFRATISLCQRLSQFKSTIVFAGSIKHAVALSISLRHLGLTSAWVSGAMSSDERERTLKAFETGAISVLINKSLLATGYDCPAISNVVLTVPIRSAVLFEQMVGRASRGPRVGGNATSTVWYFEDHIRWHGRPASYQRYALSGWR
jgi:superfamily II DNA or RNA helicase